MGEGRLTLDEGEQRLIAVYQAVYQDDLARLTADLPGNGRYAPAELPEAKTAVARRRRNAAVAAAATLAAIALLATWALSGGHRFFPGFLFFFFVLGPLTRGRRHHR